MKKNKLIFLYGIVIGLLYLASNLLFINGSQAANLNGHILLQVQAKGEAWYVDPLSSKRFYLGRPDDAFKIMRYFGLGATNSDVDTYLQTQAPARLAGRIILRVQDKGQAYYINPNSLKLHYLGRPLDAFNVIRSLGLGITNTDLSKIVVGNLDSSITPTQNPTPTPIVSASDNKKYAFKYKNQGQSLGLNLSPSIFETYRKSTKVLTYQSDNPPSNLREAFYNIFFQTKSGDTSITDLAANLTAMAKENNWSDDELLESALALVQYMPYDQDKVTSKINNPYYPYETLYLNRGVCSDKTFLALALLKKLGYGTAIMDFPDINHSAIGISCPVEYSISGSGYCYGETTNYFPIGVIPSTINGQAQSGGYEFENLFREDKLGKIEILRKTTGKTYKGVIQTREKVKELSALYTAIINLKDKGGFEYDSALDYNQKVELFNKSIKEFYQQ